MLGDPGVLILDEPVNGLDPPGIIWMRDMTGDPMPTTEPALDAFRAQATPQPAGATGETAELYDQLREAFFGFVPDVFKLVSARPDMLRVLVDGYTSMFAGGLLPREAKEVIALTVARTASCQYCISAHDSLLRLLGTDSQFADAVASGALDHPSVNPAIRALAKLARDITQHAYRVTDQQISDARALGSTEAQILEAIWVACFFNTFVRLADALGLYELGQLAPTGVGRPAPVPEEGCR
jgi:uncharacterized peroxidase-related enzyme